MVKTKRRYRTDWETKIIGNAKELLMAQIHVGEDEAYHMLRKTSMQYHKPLSELAEAVLLSFCGGSANKLLTR